MADVHLAMLFLTNFVMAGLLQVAWLHSSWHRTLAWPLDGGLQWRGRPLFGAHKTVSGFFSMVVFVSLSFTITGLVVDAQAWSAALPRSLAAWASLGAATGLGYMLGELPNSFIKRRLGLAPGATPTKGWRRHLAYFSDQVDSVAGAVLVAAPLVEAGLSFVVLCMACGPLLHGLFNVLLYMTGFKRRPA